MYLEKSEKNIMRRVVVTYYQRRLDHVIRQLDKLGIVFGSGFIASLVWIFVNRWILVNATPVWWEAIPLLLITMVIGGLIFHERQIRRAIEVQGIQRRYREIERLDLEGKERDFLLLLLKAIAERHMVAVERMISTLPLYPVLQSVAFIKDVASDYKQVLLIS